MTLLARTQALEAKAKRRREQDIRGEVAKTVRLRTANLEKALAKLETAHSRAEALGNAGHVRSSWPAPLVQALAGYDPEGASPISVESTRQAEWEKFTLSLGTFLKKVEKAIEQDIKRANQIAQYPWFANKKPWQREIDVMLKNNFKLEVEALISKDISYVTETYVPERLEDRDFLD